MDPNIFNPNLMNLYNPYIQIANLEKQVYQLSLGMGYMSVLQQKINELLLNFETLKITYNNIDSENKNLTNKIKQLEDITSKLKKSENYRKRQDKKRKKKEIKKKQQEDEEDEEEEEDEDKEEKEVKTNDKNKEEVKEMDTFVENLITGMISSGNTSGPIKSSIIIDMKTGKVLDSQFSQNNKIDSATSTNVKDNVKDDTNIFGGVNSPLSTLFSKLMCNKQKSKIENINNNENDLENQNDFSQLEKYEVQNIDSSLNNIDDVIQ